MQQTQTQTNPLNQPYYSTTNRPQSQFSNTIFFYQITKIDNATTSICTPNNPIEAVALYLLEVELLHANNK